MRNGVTIFLLAIFCPTVLAQTAPNPKSSTKKVAVAKKAVASKSTPKKTTVAAKPSLTKKGSSTKKPVAAKPTPKKKIVVAKSVVPKPTPTPVNPASEMEQFEAALASPNSAERASALKKFIIDFPTSGLTARARESLAGARAAFADEMLQANDIDGAIALFNLAVEEVPNPIPARLFNEIVLKFPANLYWHGQRSAGLEIAASIEKKADGNASQLLALATFYLGIENGADAKRLVEKSLQIDPSAAAYQTLGLAHRMNFDLDESAKAYSRALELDAESVSSKRSLAEMKRALGKPDEAAELYRDILEKNGDDLPARTGLILSLFDSGKQAEAQSEMTKSLEQNPNNLNLLAGAAYWYAAHGNGENALQFAQRAVELEPRFIWGHIALARGLLIQKKPVEAERALVMARRFGNFPTLEYEIASARLAAGFYREAVEELQKSFTLKDGLVQTNLGGRVLREEKSFADLIAFERRASIFEPLAADNSESAAKLKVLMEMVLKLDAATPNEPEIIALADEFIKGDDKMKLHRQLHAASLLLKKNIALQKVMELAKSAIGNTDAGLDVSSPAAAVMANELYESRTIAFARGEVLLVPDVPRQTLSMILRGRIEELAGWTLYQQNSFPEAIIRLRRAISVFPDKSAWWRSSVWRLGAALEANGSNKEALDSYIQSYKTDKPDVGKYFVIESLYKKVNGSLEGLEAKIGPNPLPPVVAEKSADPAVKVSENSEPKVEAATGTISEPKAQPLETAQIEPPKEPQTSEPIAKVEPTPIATPTSAEVVEKIETPEPVAKTEEPTKTLLVTDSVPQTETAVAPSDSPKNPVVEATPTKILKDLFEPIIITIPNSAAKKPVIKEPETTAETPPEEKKIEPKPEVTDAVTQPLDEAVSSGAARPRIVDGQEIRVDVPAPCSINLSQENVSLLNGGGSVGILVGIEGEGNVKDIQATSNSPADVEVTLEPDVGSALAQRFYIIKSISATTGLYQVKFETPCGKKEMLVRVR